MSKYVLPKAVKEMRFFLCQTGESSANLRSFLAKTYPTLKKHNPTIPLLVREAEGVTPTVIARLEKGKETKLSLSGLDTKGIASAIQKLVGAS